MAAGIPGAAAGRRMRRGAATLAIAAVCAGLAACGDDGAPSAATGDAPAVSTTVPTATTTRAEPQAPPRPRALPGLPGFTAGFEDWPRLNAAPIPPDSPDARSVGFDAHRGVKNVHVRGDDAPGPPYPDGTVVVKAAGDDPSRPTLVAVMRKVAGADPAHGDWRFREWKRAAPGDTFTTSDALTGATCWSCHAAAADTDWVFTEP